MNRVSKVKTKWKYKMKAGIVIKCAICKEPISPGGDKSKGHLTADHIIPKALGGTDAKENLQPAHSSCNAKRGHLLIEEFADLSSQKEILRRAIEIVEQKERKSIWQKLLNTVNQR